jgi:hypothetical protein
MDNQFLTVRLSESEAALVAHLGNITGESKTDIVKRALRRLAESEVANTTISLFDLGASRFGKQGSASRQSADIKSVVRSRAHAKRG